jgi:hypothetical protein
MAKLTYESAQDYRLISFTAVLPDGSELEIDMVPPTQAEIWQLAHDMPEEPKPPRKGWEKPTGEDKVYPAYDNLDAGYITAMAEWNRDYEMHRLVLCWGDNLPGDTADEKVKALETLPNIILSALFQCARQTVRLAEGAVKPVSFRGD